MRHPNRFSRKGSFALEAAIVLPAVLLLGTSLIWLLIDLQAEIKLKGAVDRMATELSLLSPACELLLQSDGAVNSSAVASQSDPAGGWTALFQEFLPEDQIEEFLADALLDLSSSAVLGRLLQSRLDYWLDELCAGQPGWTQCIGRRKLYLDWRLDRQQLWIHLSYQLRTPLGGILRQKAAAVPLWIGSGGKRDGREKSDEVWLLDNFSRGQQLRQSYGSNLPANFPVIARFSSGEALSVKSMDLTAPSYQEPSAVLDRIGYQVKLLADFQGTDHDQAEQVIRIIPEEITSRRLLLIIPDNCRQSWLGGVLGEAARKASDAGVSLEVVRQGKSTRYTREED